MRVETIWSAARAGSVANEVAEVAGKLKRVSLDAEEAVLEVRAKSLQTELVAKQVEKTLLDRTTESRERELSRGRIRMRELRGADAGSRDDDTGKARVKARKVKRGPNKDVSATPAIKPSSKGAAVAQGKVGSK